MTEEELEKPCWRDFPCVEWYKYPCCDNEKRNMNGWCENCGDPCF